MTAQTDISFLCGLGVKLWTTVTTCSLQNGSNKTIYISLNLQVAEKNKL